MQVYGLEIKSDYLDSKMETFEIYLPRQYFVQQGGFSDDDFRLFTQTLSIRPNSKGDYPVFLVMTTLNSARKKGRWGTGDADTALKRARIKSVELATSIKSKEYVPTVLARNRMKSMLLAVANKIRYSIKVTAPRMIGLLSARDAESILTEGYNNAIDSLLIEADELKTWEQYGFDSIEGGRDQLVEDTNSDLSSGSGEENKIIDEKQCP
jgi:hypothetical protein